MKYQRQLSLQERVLKKKILEQKYGDFPPPLHQVSDQSTEIDYNLVDLNLDNQKSPSPTPSYGTLHLSILFVNLICLTLLIFIASDILFERQQELQIITPTDILKENPLPTRIESIDKK